MSVFSYQLECMLSFWERLHLLGDFVFTAHHVESSTDIIKIQEKYFQAFYTFSLITSQMNDYLSMYLSVD